MYFERSSYEVDEDDDINIRVNVNRGGPKSDVDIPITWTNGSDTVNADYDVSGLNGSDELEIDKGDSYKTFHFDAEIDNDCVDGQVTFTFGSLLPSGIDRGNPGSTTVTINDTHCPTPPTPASVNFSSSSYSVEEGDEREIQVNLSKSLSNTVKIPISWRNVSAENADYVVEGLTDNKLTIPSGSTSGTFTVDSAEDNTDCDNETINFTIGSSLPTSVTRGTTYRSTLTITDDEDASDCLPLVSVARSSNEITEGDSVTFYIRTNKRIPTSILVPLNSTTTGDFFRNKLPSSVRIPANRWSTSFPVNTVGDTVDEPHGSVEVGIDSSTAYRTSRGSRTTFVRILDDDDPPVPVPTVSISASPTSVTEGTDITFTVRANRRLTSPLTVDLSHSTSGSFFDTFPPDDVTIRASSSYTTFKVETDDDSIDETNGHIVVSIDRSDSNYSRGASSVRVPVMDDDDPPAPPPTPTPIPNRPPTVQITTQDKTIDGGESVALKATSADPDGDRLTYSWWSTSGSFTSVSALNSTWKAPVSQRTAVKYTVVITASDGDLFATDSVTFTVRMLPVPSKPTIQSGVPGSRRGWIALDWNSTAGASAYQILQLKNGSYTVLNSTTSPAEVSIDQSETTAVVLGLDPDAQQVYSFKVRAINQYGWSDSDAFEVNIRPRPQSLAGKYHSGHHKKITLTWNAVPNPNATYVVEQHFPDLIPSLIDPNDDWETLTTNAGDNDGVSIGAITSSGGKLSVVVSGLEPGDEYGETKEYKYRVSANSVQGLSEPSDEASGHVLNESPRNPPSNFAVSIVPGNRGFLIKWDPDNDAEWYEVGLRSFSKTEGIDLYNHQSGPVTVGPLTSDNRARVDTHGRKSTISLRAYGLDYKSYTVTVKPVNGSGYGPAVSKRLTAPRVMGVGHQADHNAKYIKGTIDDPIVENSLATAATEWNTRMRPLTTTTGGPRPLSKGLSICEGCSDKHSITIETRGDGVNSTSTVPNWACGDVRACVRWSLSTIVSNHVVGATMIFESPPWTTRKQGRTKVHQRYQWTDIVSLDGSYVPGTGKTVKFQRIDRVVLHEFGHLLGLPDFYKYTETKNLQAIMRTTSVGISDDHDIDQLRAIYIKHKSH